ncbi:TAT-binding protein-like protein 7, AAA ATPase [Ophidiomyces ophidiicola]|uniref:TAT-binding protein-like protein 7, AAA ATPase n=1 Tax=Ophidiomyces ophidiicola TaxID=1387563 RepID=UPI0020C4381C|nr:TAT-binding protein-like protein 7, AAA ATPase [Ophidiomyces ophidiicola]KAI1917163.1 TAT-binding protein-like protein 7, AAA ATPase [Ophidiomyces ophidiicola]KAI1929717.1 TAT-binding protein-like protein 7, AAA ATPase [Ophidiomyces ophidiicola]KAI1946481.1 TAT-binding protein-like protein 7, AAA ATPase [Ophidiomyces ophidiicola]KAI1960471.1 TAT-binding protein-like protein 7, AAA ATPase [Ophidiomyces ophidiicola]KAI1969411.1 TAT-binding protein-like protein 7, AAA ATPase [Ophidiomyces ophi
MPRAHPKRTMEEIANQSNSSDEDYDDQASRARKTSSKLKQAKKRPVKKQKRNADSDDELSEISDTLSMMEEIEESEDEPEDDLNVERTLRGSVKRQAAKNAKTYISSSSESGSAGEEEEEEQEEEQPGDGVEATPQRRAPPKRLLLKLSVPKVPLETPLSSRSMRSTRARSAGIQDNVDVKLTARFGNRRVTRQNRDECEDIVALSGSGRHVEMVREGTRSPVAGPRTRKTAKTPNPTDAIIEEHEPDSKPDQEDSKDQPEQDCEGSPQLEIMESDHQGSFEDQLFAVVTSHTVTHAPSPQEQTGDQEMADEPIVPESKPAAEEDEDEEEDAPILSRRTRQNRNQKSVDAPAEEEETTKSHSLRRSTRSKARKSPRKRQDDGSDFEPAEDEAVDDDLSDSETSNHSPRKNSQNPEEPDDSSNGRRSRLRKRLDNSQAGVESEADELAVELAELKRSRPRRRLAPEIVYEKPRRARKSVDYRIIRPELALPIEEAENDITESPSRRPRGGGGGGWQRTLLSTYGPFGGGGPPPLLGGPHPLGAIGGVESDSSDDDAMQKPKPAGLTAVAAPSILANTANLSMPGQLGNNDAAQALSGTPANLGKIKDRQALADSDPLGVDPNVNFDNVGGLQGHIEQLKEMVSLPLLYPEVFQRLRIVPPRGVLFHGPPGTGKTLLARALATSVSTEGKKVTFYMRKGADALSKWVGEAERQLRLLFEEARKTQPSIIFFDEIDGLAPVRSSKQEQIHASIVSTLLALMDGMDGRGQVIVIGATNRPDSIDPALRRPGRFDREFYFPLPNTEARRSIINIHTNKWVPPLSDEVKDELADLTKGYGGADLRALCTEAALNAVQRIYPQIYQSKERLLIDPAKIIVTPKDFMISLKKIVPSSERSTSSGASPLPPAVEPLLRHTLKEIKELVGQVLPQKKTLTALEEAQYEQPDDDAGFRHERMQQAFERSRVFRPRLLIRGRPGMGQQYLAAAILQHFEGIHVQSFDLPTLLSDPVKSPETAMVHLFAEVKRHKPSVIYIPNIETWYNTVEKTVISTFIGLLRSLPPTDPVLLLGFLESSGEDVDPEMMRSLFGFSKKNRYNILAPKDPWRQEFFQAIIDYIITAPNDFPDPQNRKKRKLEVLEIAPPDPALAPAAPSKEELKAQKKKDRQTLNLLKIRIQPIMDQIKRSYKRFRAGPVDEAQIRYLFDDQDPNVVTSDLPLEQRTTFRPFERDEDKFGIPGLREVVSGKFYYNIDIVVIEKRLSNGYYKRPKDFLADIKRLAKDAKMLDDPDRLLKANELLSNVEVDIGLIDQTESAFVAECENVYLRELERERLAIEKAKKEAEAADKSMAPPPLLNIAHGVESSNQLSGPVVLGETFGSTDNGVPPVRPYTPNTDNAALTNGDLPQADTTTHNVEYRPDSNGSIFDKSGDVDGDIQMSNSDDISGFSRETQSSSFGPAAQPRPPHSYTAPSQQLRQQSGISTLSQKGTMTPMAPNSQPGDYTNDASTTQTTSDKKNSGHSELQLHTQTTFNFSMRHEGPDLNLYPYRMSDDEQLPDTQSAWGSQPTPLRGGGVYSQINFINGTQRRFDIPGSQHRPPPIPPFSTQPEAKKPASEASKQEDEPEHPELIVDDSLVEQLHAEFTAKTAGFSVEDLEQINTSLMDCIWNMRGEWDRRRVAEAVHDAFDEVLSDIESMQLLDQGPAARPF